jgi:uroporphyrinogen-III synthase
VKLRVLVTRPRFDALRTAKRLSALGHETIIDSVIEIEVMPFNASSDGCGAIVFTSANAVRAAASHESLKRIPVFAVGERTGEAAHELGFQSIRIAGGDVIALGGLIASELPGGAKILHLAGEDRAGDLSGQLKQSGISVETRIIYRAHASDALNPETVISFRQNAIEAVLHYSERSAATFVRLTETAGTGGDIRKTRHLCLSSAVAAPLNSIGARTEIAATPDEEALLALLNR